MSFRLCVRVCLCVSVSTMHLYTQFSSQPLVTSTRTCSPKYKPPQIILKELISPSSTPSSHAAAEGEPGPDLQVPRRVRLVHGARLLAEAEAVPGDRRPAAGQVPGGRPGAVRAARQPAAHANRGQEPPPAGRRQGQPQAAGLPAPVARLLRTGVGRLQKGHATFGSLQIWIWLRPEVTPGTSTEHFFNPSFFLISSTLRSDAIQGRQCNGTSTGPDGCASLCCGRGHRSRSRLVEEKCNCKFVWCCKVNCDVCSRPREEQFCN